MSYEDTNTEPPVIDPKWKQKTPEYRRMMSEKITAYHAKRRRAAARSKQQNPPVMTLPRAAMLAIIRSATTADLLAEIKRRCS